MASPVHTHTRARARTRTSLPLNTFLQLLGHVRRLVSIGEDFSQSKADILEVVLRKKSLAYFKVYHQRTLETLREHTTKDSWTAMAVVPDFNIFFLKEFSFLRRGNSQVSKSLFVLRVQMCAVLCVTFFARFVCGGTPDGYISMLDIKNWIYIHIYKYIYIHIHL